MLIELAKAVPVSVPLQATRTEPITATKNRGTLFIFILNAKSKNYYIGLGKPCILPELGGFYKNMWILLGGCLTVKN